jgi:hypothetical protein
VISKKQKEKLDERFGEDYELDTANDKDSNKLAEKKHLKRLRGTIFTKCELPNELFNANRLVKTKIK